MDAACIEAPGALQFLLDETPLGQPNADGMDAVDDHGAPALWSTIGGGWSHHARCVHTPRASNE